MNGITYTKPKVTLLQQSGLGVAEVAGRTCYDSFNNSENEAVKNKDLKNINEIEGSKLLNSLAWVYHHNSIVEHATLSYLIEGTSRAVLVEHSRHRIQAISVRSTRYTMHTVINAFVATKMLLQDISITTAKGVFLSILKDADMFVIEDEMYLAIEINAIYNKLLFQFNRLGQEEFFKISLVKKGIESVNEAMELINLNLIESTYILFQSLQNGKNKRNIGDPFKHIVTDNWKVDMVVTFNIRSLKNYFDLRDAGSAYFQIQWLAQEMKKITPHKYLRLICKEFRDV